MLEDKFDYKDKRLGNKMSSCLLTLTMFTALKTLGLANTVILTRMVILQGKGGKTSVINFIQKFVPPHKQFNGDLTDATEMLYFSDESNHMDYTSKSTRRNTFLKIITVRDKLRYENKYGFVDYFENTGIGYQTTNTSPTLGSSKQYASHKRRFLFFHLNKSLKNKDQDLDHVDNVLKHEALKTIILTIHFSAYHKKCRDIY
jgi:hypothetical protein